MSRPLTALIIDDEAPARSELRYLLDALGGVEVLGEAASGREALQLIGSIAYDVAFVDIEMPGLTGVQLAERLATLERRPAIVFVTAHSKHAVKAFEVAAVDFLVKPVELPRLERAVRRVLRFRDDQEASRRAAAPPGGPARLDCLPVERGGNKLLLDAADIQHVVAHDDYTYVHVAGERYISNLTLNEIEKRLTPFGFLRVHRCHLVNLSKVAEVVPMYGGTLLLTLGKRGETQIPVSRRRAAALRQALGL